MFQASLIPIQKYLDKNHSLARALNCLAHPTSLMCIIALIVNDMVVKYLWPSWFSGKLSDFAGLYFFPFLLGVLISLILRHRDINSERVGQISISITGIWFALIKLSPTVNQVTSSLAEAVTRSPSVIALDPSDIVATIVLIPSWFLWKSINLSQSRWKSVLIFIVASIATMGTTSIQYDKLTKLTTHEGNIYISTELGQVSVSKDSGRTWQTVDPAPQMVFDEFERERVFPLVICFEDNPKYCYRIRGNETIERSLDEGSTYQVVWEPPPDRRYFMDRYTSSVFAFSSKGLDIGPYDMKLLGSSLEPIIVAAAGDEGVIVGSERSGWERISVGRFEPTPYYYFDPISIFSTTSQEAMILMIIGLSFASILSWTNLKLVIRLADRRNGLALPISQIMNPARYSLIAILSITFLTGLFILPLYFFGLIFGPFIFSVYVAILLIGFVTSWRNLSRSLGERGKLGKIPALGIVSGFLIFPVAYLPFTFWVAGIIPWYQLAVIISIVIFFPALYIGFWVRKEIRVIFQPGTT